MIRDSALLLFVIGMGIGATDARAAEPSSQVDAARKKLGYAIGQQVGSDFSQSGKTLDVEALVAGMRDALRRESPRWTPEEMREALRLLQESQRRERAEKDEAPPSRE